MSSSPSLAIELEQEDLGVFHTLDIDQIEDENEELAIDSSNIASLTLLPPGQALTAFQLARDEYRAAKEVRDGLFAQMVEAEAVVKTAKLRYDVLKAQDASPTTPSIAGKCILPKKPSKDPANDRYCQLRRGDGVDKPLLYYKTATNRTSGPVLPGDPRIFTTKEIRDKGFVIYDGSEVKVHHRDV